jgi:hypothetical protein
MLRLGTQTGSLINNIMSRSVIGEPLPEIGMGATMLSWTDRNPATIVTVFSKGKTQYVGVNEDDAVRTDSNGYSESQTYEFSFNPHVFIQYYRKTSKGTWEGCYINPETGRFVKGNGSLSIGQRGKYWDPSF